MLTLAERLCHCTGSDQVHFLNTGAEANEGAIKLARKWGQLHRNGAHRIITATRSCHGRSFGAMSASGTGTFDNRFEPQLPGFINVPFNDLPPCTRRLMPKQWPSCWSRCKAMRGLFLPPSITSKA